MGLERHLVGRDKDKALLLEQFVPNHLPSCLESSMGTLLIASTMAMEIERLLPPHLETPPRDADAPDRNGWDIEPGILSGKTSPACEGPG